MRVLAIERRSNFYGDHNWRSDYLAYYCCNCWFCWRIDRPSAQALALVSGVLRTITAAGRDKQLFLRDTIPFAFVLVAITLMLRISCQRYRHHINPHSLVIDGQAPVVSLPGSSLIGQR